MNTSTITDSNIKTNANSCKHWCYVVESILYWTTGLHTFHWWSVARSKPVVEYWRIRCFSRTLYATVRWPIVFPRFWKGTPRDCWAFNQGFLNASNRKCKVKTYLVQVVLPRWVLLQMENSAESFLNSEHFLTTFYCRRWSVIWNNPALSDALCLAPTFSLWRHLVALQNNKRLLLMNIK